MIKDIKHLTQCTDLQNVEENRSKEVSAILTEDSIRLYLKEIGNAPLLTAKEEIAVAMRMEQGDLRAKEELINRKTQQFMTEYNREPEAFELAQLMEMNVDKIEEILAVYADTVSLETPIGIEGDSSLGDFIADENTTKQYEIAEQT